MHWINPNTFQFDYFLPKFATPAKVKVGVFYREETDTFCVMLEQVWIEHDQKAWSLTDIISEEVLHTIDKEAQNQFAAFVSTGAKHESHTKN